MLVALIYIVAFTSLLAGAAAAIEWAAQGRVPTRHLWSAAIALALLVPVATIAYKSTRPHVAAPAQAHTGPSYTTERLTLADPAASNAERAWIARAVSSPAVTMGVAAAWALFSLALAAWATAGVARWRTLRRSWRAERMDGVEVHVSHSTGPAVLGIITQRIVMPAWATSMPPEQRQLMLAHECEHVSAHDPQRLAIALGALILMPWNAALWWCAARLRRAIEIDCDARVLRRHPRAKEYGYLLLEVASRGRNAGALAVPLVGLLRLPSELELRLRAMTRPRSIAVRTLAAGGAAAIAAVTAAFVAPVPTVHLPSPIVTRTSSSARRTAVSSETQPARETRLRENLMVLRTAHAVSEYRDTATRVLEMAAPHRDSLEALARKLAMTSRDSTRGVLDVMVLDETETMPHAANAVRVVEVSNPATEMQAEMSRTDRDIDTLISRYYPDMTGGSSTPVSSSVWFLVSRNGNVIATDRTDDDPHPVSLESVTTHYPQIDPSTIRLMSVSKKSVRGNRMSVVWVQLNT